MGFWYRHSQVRILAPQPSLSRLRSTTSSADTSAREDHPRIDALFDGSVLIDGMRNHAARASAALVYSPSAAARIPNGRAG